MNKQPNMPNYIIILGTTYSGSGAVYDYLAGRGDLYDPLKGTEYQLPQMPNGLMALEATAKNAFHPATADFVLDQFKEITNKLARSQAPWHYGKGYARMIPNFQNAIGEFIEEVSAAKLPMNWHWRRLMRVESPIMHIIDKLKIRIGLNERPPQTRLIVSEENLLSAAQTLHSKIFQSDPENRPVLLNQAGSGWNPIESTKYFLNRKVILVTRDPRDQFLEIKQYKKATSVEGFIDWYKEMQRRLEKINNSDLLFIQFEDFVNNNIKMVEALCNHTSISSSINSSYQPNLSKKNIGKYKKFLSEKEIDIIESHLSEYINTK